MTQLKNMFRKFCYFCSLFWENRSDGGGMTYETLYKTRFYVSYKIDFRN